MFLASGHGNVRGTDMTQALGANNTLEKETAHRHVHCDLKVAIIAKVNGSLVAQHFLNRTPTLGMKFSDSRSKIKHLKDTCSKEIGLYLQIFITTLQSLET